MSDTQRANKTSAAEDVRQPLFTTQKSLNGNGSKETVADDVIVAASNDSLPSYCSVNKDGSSNFVTSLSERKLVLRYLVDAMTSLAELPFYYHVTMFVVTQFASWTLFGLIWWLMAALHGDLLTNDEIYLLDARQDSMCTIAVYDFTSALLFSVETQATTGYGSRVPNPACAQSLSLLVIQMVVGLIINCVTAGLVYDKLTRLNSRTRLIRFSRQAAVYYDSNASNYCIAVRVWYSGRSPMLSASVKALFVQHCAGSTKQQLSVPGIPRSVELQLETEYQPNDDQFVLFSWPETLIHRVTSSSPLWNLTPIDFAKFQCELIYVVEGAVESTGTSCQYVKSYTAANVTWGRKFAELEFLPMASSQKCCFRFTNGQSCDCCRTGSKTLDSWMINCDRFDDLVKCEG